MKRKQQILPSNDLIIVIPKLHFCQLKVLKCTKCVLKIQTVCSGTPSVMELHSRYRISAYMKSPSHLYCAYGDLKKWTNVVINTNPPATPHIYPSTVVVCYCHRRVSQNIPTSIHFKNLYTKYLKT